MTTPRTMFEKVWAEHQVTDIGAGYHLIYIDRCFLHDLSGPSSLKAIRERQLPIFSPDLVFAMPDHLVSSDPGRGGGNDASRESFISSLREECGAQRIALFDVDDHRQGIVHVVGPANGITLPGATVVCGDSHTCTHGGIGAIAWGVGNSELSHVLATQCIIERKPRTLQLRFSGKLPPGASAKDMMLRLISEQGSDFGEGYAIEYTGEAIEGLSIEERLTVCNLSIECGARIGFVAPDKKTLDYLRTCDFAPKGKDFESAAAYWLSLRSDEGASFDQVIEVNVSNLQPQISWGINPSHTIGVNERIPDPIDAPDEITRQQWQTALDYMGLKAGGAIQGTPIDQVFIGSCANSRLSDLAAAAELLQNRKVAAGVEAWVVPGSQQVKQAAEAKGIDRLFKQAGFQWREPGCSLCPAANGDQVAPGRRCVSTSNRNFIGRQGPRSRTHLASPETAVAAAIQGYITDPRHISD